MRATIGFVGVLGLGLSVTAALAQGPRQRGATLLPPQAVAPGEADAVARAAAPELPPFPDSTPVFRGAKTPPGPTWLGGTDPNVRPAAATAAAQPQPGGAKDEPSLVTRSLDKLKVAIAGTDRGGKPERPAAPPANVSAEAPGANPEGPFRGTTASGAPVYAGPPAYRWYGWGSVTPGANPFAPTGHYPKASANWYAITGATPGAFPVPVMNPLRPAAGTEPPAYAATPGPRTAPPPTVTYTPTPEPTRAPAAAPPAPPTPMSAFQPPPADLSKFGPADVKPLPVPAAPSLPPRTLTPVGIPTLAAPPGAGLPLPTMPVAEPTAEKEPNPTAPKLVVVSSPSPTARALAVSNPVFPPPTVEPGPVVEEQRATAPAALPVSVTDDQPKWQPTPERSAGGEWTPAGKQSVTPAQAPTPAPVTSAAPDWQPTAAGNAPAKPVARAQAADTRPDAVAALIRKMCDGRADGVDVRWTGTKRATVCFECRTAPEAQQLVKDISARPELAPFQIDFCVLVK